MTGRRKVAIGYAVIALIGGTFLFGQVLPRGIEQKPPVQQEQKEYAPTPETVNLPAGQKFVNIISAEDATTIVSNYGVMYVTADRPKEEAPRRLTLAQHGRSPGRWEVRFYIQEH